MIGEHSALDLILGASFAVQCVMALLAAASVVSWAIIFRKRRVLGEARIKAADVFEDKFWSGGDLAALYKSLEGTSPHRHVERLRVGLPRVLAPAPAGRARRRAAARRQRGAR